MATLLAYSPLALALGPSLDISQYAHTAWKISEGFGKGAIKAIAQTPDSYLWLGTKFGWLPFDGVQTVSWQLRESEYLRSNPIRTLLVSRDGALWIAIHQAHCSSAADGGRPGSSGKEAEMHS